MHTNTSIQRNERVHKSGESPTALSSLQQNNTSLKYKQTGLFWSKSPKQRENKVSSCIRWSDLPFCVEYIGSQMLILWSNCQVLGQGCRSEEIWMLGPQDKWFWQLLKTYPQILQVGSHFWVTKNCYWVQAHTAHHTTSNKSRGSLLVQGIASRPKRWWPHVQSTILPELELKFL